MTYRDKSIQCIDCGRTFLFTGSEQEFYASKGLPNQPKRCPECRARKRAERINAGGYRSTRQMYPAVCAECGRDTMVPFEPHGDRPVYCADCYAKRKR